MEVLLAQLNYTVGDLQGNTAKILQVFERYGNEVDLIVFSELCLLGGVPQDLLAWPGIITLQEDHLHRIREATRDAKAGLVLGFVDRNPFQGRPYHNAVTVFAGGSEVFVYHKKFVSSTEEFDESRYFEPGRRPEVFSFRGTRLAIAVREEAETAFEDPWPGAEPVERFVSQKPELILCLGSSPSRFGQQARRHFYAGRLARACDAPLIFVNQIGGNDQAVFDGASFAVSRTGELSTTLSAFAEQCRRIEVHAEPAAAESTAPPMERTSLIYHQLLTGLRDYVEKCGFREVVLGVSGGIDSALTLSLATRALGAQRVKALLMPSRHTRESSLRDARQLCGNLGLTPCEINIDGEFDVALESFSAAFGEDPAGITRENMQARIRGRILMAYSNQHQALVISTGNRSEMSVGYVTLYGDMDGGIALLGDLYKTDVYALAHFYNKQNQQQAIPEAIFEKSPSAELSAEQRDEDVLPPYAVLDAILRLYFEGCQLADEERRDCIATLRSREDREISRVLSMVVASEFKRRQAPPVIKMQRSSFAVAQTLPIAARYPGFHGLADLIGRSASGNRT